MDDKEKRIINYLRNYNLYKMNVISLNENIIDLCESGMGIDYSKDKLSKTNKFSSVTEDSAIELEKLEITKRLKTMKRLINRIDRAVSSLNKTEKIVITNSCIKKMFYYQYCNDMNCSSRTIQRIKKAALKKMEIVIYGNLS